MNMRKLIPLLIIFLFIFTSCATNRGNGGYSAEEKALALEVLSRDMIEGAEAEGDIDAAFFEEALPESYTAYDGYSPAYDSLTDTYVSELSSIVSPALENIYPLLIGRIPEAVEGGDIEQMVTAPEGMTDRLQELTAREVYALLQDEISSVYDSVSSAFFIPHDIFISLRDAYENLESVNAGISLPIPESFSVDSLAFIAEDALFTRLGENEVRLKSALPESSDSLYSVFWEETI